jgi:hypothetical protein
MKQIIFIFLVNILCDSVFAQAPDNFAFREIVYDTKCNKFVAQIYLPQPYKDLDLTNPIWNTKISNYENLSGNLLNQEVLDQINHFQNQNLYSSYYKPKLHISNNFYFSTDSLNPKKSKYNVHSPTPLFVAVCSTVGGLAGAAKGVSKPFTDSGYILSNIVLGILMGGGAAYLLVAIFH